MTPIFTTLRRGGWRGPRQDAWPAHCPPPAPSPSPRPQFGSPRFVSPQFGSPQGPAPDAAARYRDDPLTAMLPVVPAVAVDHGRADGSGAGPVDPYAPASFVLASPSPTEATTWWPAPLVDPHDHLPAYEPVPYEPVPYDPGYGASGYSGSGYGHPGYGEAGHVEAAYEEPGYADPGHGDAGYAEPVWYDSRRRRRFPDPMSYDPVTDSGRHHRRLAPAGW